MTTATATTARRRRFFTPGAVPTTDTDALLPGRWRGHAFAAVMPRHLIHTLWVVLIVGRAIDQGGYPLVAWLLVLAVAVPAAIFHIRAVRQAERLNAALAARLNDPDTV